MTKKNTIIDYKDKRDEKIHPDHSIANDLNFN